MKNFNIKTDLPDLSKKTTEPVLNLLQIPMTHKEVLRYILYRNNLDKWELNQNNIANHLNCSSRNVIRILKYLKDIGILSSFRKGNYYFYILNFHLSNISIINQKAHDIFNKKHMTKLDKKDKKAHDILSPEHVTFSAKAHDILSPIYLNTILNIKLIYSYHHLLSTYLCKKEKLKTGSKNPKNFQTETVTKNDNDDKKNILKINSELLNENQTDNFKTPGDSQMKNFNLDSILETLEQIETEKDIKKIKIDIVKETYVNSFPVNLEISLHENTNQYDLSFEEKTKEFDTLNQVNKNQEQKEGFFALETLETLTTNENPIILDSSNVGKEKYSGSSTAPKIKEPENETDRIFNELFYLGFGNYGNNSEEDQRQQILKFIYGKDLLKLSQIIEVVKRMDLDNPAGYIYKTYDDPKFQVIPEVPKPKTKEINQEISGLIKYFKLSITSTSSRHDIVRMINNKYNEYSLYNKNKMDWIQKQLNLINKSSIIPDNIKKDMIYRVENMEEITSKFISDILDLVTLEKLKDCFVSEGYEKEWNKVFKFLAYFRDNPKHRDNSKVVNFHRVNPKTITNELFNNG